MMLNTSLILTHTFRFLFFFGFECLNIHLDLWEAWGSPILPPSSTIPSTSHSIPTNALKKNSIVSKPNLQHWALSIDPRHTDKPDALNHWKKKKKVLKIFNSQSLFFFSPNKLSIWDINDNYLIPPAPMTVHFVDMQECIPIHRRKITFFIGVVLAPKYFRDSM